MASNVKWARNLSKNQLGGVVFGCTQSTMRECLTNQLFGLPASHFFYVKNIDPGLPLFLFDYSERKLHGIYEAASSGAMGIDSYAWTEDGSDRTKYPAQVQIRLRVQCQALPEKQFKPIIIDNYYSQSHFWFELDHAQANKLMSKLLSYAVAPGTFIPKKNPRSTVSKRKESRAYVNSHDSIGSSTNTEDSLFLNGNNQLMMDILSHDQIAEYDEKDIIYMKLRELAVEFPDASEYGVDFEHQTRNDDLTDLEKENGGNSFNSLDYPSVIAQLCREMEELKTFKQEHSQKMGSVEKKLAEAEQKIHSLENRCLKLESVLDTSTILSGDDATLLKSPAEIQFNLNESILIVGGYDGASWSSALHSFSPTHDVLKSLMPMSSVRSYASVASFNGELYVFGGGTGSKWYDTVESYNVANDVWSPRPCLNKEKGSLACAVLNGKIFVVGGGNGIDCFADVEMFDPHVGRWISARSMIEKRFALAAVELNGAIYAVGGYDGYEYLKSVERFDPREHSWTRIKSMDAKRGCHSLVTMNEKIYALGGYDGTTMVPTVEIYDPRLGGTWMDGEPMNESRGYSAAAVLNEFVYVIGGVKGDEDIVDKVECYKEGQGWQSTNLTAVGKRCFASAIVFKDNKDMMI